MKPARHKTGPKPGFRTTYPHNPERVLKIVKARDEGFTWEAIAEWLEPEVGRRLTPPAISYTFNKWERWARKRML